MGIDYVGLPERCPKAEEPTGLVECGSSQRTPNFDLRIHGRMKVKDIMEQVFWLSAFSPFCRTVQCLTTYMTWRD